MTFSSTFLKRFDTLYILMLVLIGSLAVVITIGALALAFAASFSPETETWLDLHETYGNALKAASDNITNFELHFLVNKDLSVSLYANINNETTRIIASWPSPAALQGPNGVFEVLETLPEAIAGVVPLPGITIVPGFEDIIEDATDKTGLNFVLVENEDLSVTLYGWDNKTTTPGPDGYYSNLDNMTRLAGFTNSLALHGPNGVVDILSKAPSWNLTTITQK